MTPRRSTHAATGESSGRRATRTYQADPKATQPVRTTSDSTSMCGVPERTSPSGSGCERNALEGGGETRGASVPDRLFDQRLIVTDSVTHCQSALTVGVSPPGDIVHQLLVDFGPVGFGLVGLLE
jgi:hypothetical protein